MSLSIAIVERTAPPTTKYSGWRVLHKAEGGYQRNPATMPSVIPPIPSVAIDMTEEVQHMSYDLMVHFNDQITPNLWTKVHDGDRAFTNFLGFGTRPGCGGPRKNYIKNEDMTYPLPKYDKAQRVCGGQFVRGIERGGMLVIRPGIDAIDATKLMPSIETIVANNWYGFAVVVGPEGNEGAISHFPQGQGGPVAIPFIVDREISFPLAYFERWEGDTLPDPLKVGA